MIFLQLCRSCSKQTWNAWKAKS